MENATALSVVKPAPLGTLEFTPEQRKMIRDSFANGASDSEFAVLMEVARARRLNPLMRQIYFVKRWDGARQGQVWSTQISIDGLRAVAERTGLYDGQSEPLFEYDGDKRVSKCTVHVYRKDWSAGRSAVGVAFFSEYAQTKRDGGLTTFWATKPHIMLAKCAEALAIRKAFPEDTSGLYVPEEMGEGAEAPTPHPAATPEVLPPEEKKAAPAPQSASSARAGLPPGHVIALWNRVKDEYESPKAEFERAAKQYEGTRTKPTTDWTLDDTKHVEAILFPAKDDVQF